MTQIRTRDLVALLRGFPALIAAADRKTITIAFDYLRDLTADLVQCGDARHHLGWYLVVQDVKPVLRDLFPALAVEELPDSDYWCNDVVNDARQGGIPLHRLEALRQWALDIERKHGETQPLTPEVLAQLRLAAERS